MENILKINYKRKKYKINKGVEVIMVISEESRLLNKIKSVDYVILKLKELYNKLKRLINNLMKIIHKLVEKSKNIIKRKIR